jgi:NAD(P)-dependent dehydrogenase (short-subunit alcohol dehydrogenase family)
MPAEISRDELTSLLKALTALRQQPHLFLGNDPVYAEIRSQAAALLRALKAAEKQAARQRDRELLDATLMRSQRSARAGGPAAPATEAGHGNPLGTLELSRPCFCYICRRPFTQLHFFYHALCPSCGDFNYAKRGQTANLQGKVALVTGARIRIGFQTALKLLRCGAVVVATTRFPRDAARRFLQESDAGAWKDWLRIFGLDLRHLPAVERFTDFMQTAYERLDGIVNNAAQTVRRPPAFYRHLLARESAPLTDVPPDVQRLLGPAPSAQAGAGSELAPAGPGTSGPGLPLSAVLSQVPLLAGDEHSPADLFPPGEYDADGQQLDRRPHNSWNLKLGEVTTVELVEVHAVNCLAPFLLLSRLEPLLLRDGQADKYVINVSASEGQFAGAYKTGHHPHTNMAKAALNMMTRTCAASWAEKRVFLNSVDTGFISNQLPYPAARQLEEKGMDPPLDETDGAARVCDPIFTGLNTGQNVYGKFLKHYREAPW